MPHTESRLVDRAFPPELLLDIITQLPFEDGSIITTLKNTHSRIRELLQVYQRSITRAFVKKEVRHAFVDFPRVDEQQQGYKWLQQCIKDYDVIDDVMAVLASNLNCRKVERHNMALVNTGLLLLYRLNELESHSAKVDFIKSLPQDPLTAMFIAINHAAMTARYHSEGLMNQRTYGGPLMDADAFLLRCDVEFAFAEGCLQLGTPFVDSIFNTSPTAEVALLNLYQDHATQEWDMEMVELGGVKPPVTEGPHRCEQSSLWTTLLARLSELVQCPLNEIKRRIEEGCDVEDHSLAYLTLNEKERLVKGLDLEYVDG